MLSYLLEETNAAAGTGNGWEQYIMWILVGIIIIGFAVWMFFSSKKRKKQEQEAKDLIDAVKPGNKVKTIGGVCGIVVEVNSEENTFVLETGSENTGKSYVKFDKQAIYQTDAVVEKNAPAKITDEEAPVESASAETTAAESVDAPEISEGDKPVLIKPKKDKKTPAEENKD